MADAPNVNDLLQGHVTLDLECLDRIYLNAYVPNLQVGGQVVTFLTTHLGYPIPSPALFNRIGTRFREAMTSFAKDNGIPLVRFRKDDRKADVMRPYLEQATKPGVVAIGVAQEHQSVITGYEQKGRTGASRFGFQKQDRRVSVYYAYLWDDDFGPAFIKLCTYFPYPAKGTSGPSARRPSRASPSPPLPTGSHPPTSPHGCRGSATGWGPTRSSPSSSGGWP